MNQKTVLVLLFLFLLSFAFKCYYLDKTPFIEDESLYAEMIAEEADNPTFLPTYLGYPAPWKPGIYFITYSLFLPLTSHLFDSFEWAYRFPNLLFSLLSAVLIYLIAKRFYSKDAALAASLIFFSSIPSFYVETRLLMEPMVLTIVLASLFFYTKEKKSTTDFLMGGTFALIAALTKSVISLVIPLLALVYIFTREKPTLSNPVFLLSLLGAPLGIAIFYFSLIPIGFAEEVFLVDIGRSVLYDYSSLVSFAYQNFSMIFGFLFLFFVSGVAVFLKKEKPEPMLLAWIALILVLLISSTFRPWYLYYFLPPICIISAIAILNKEKIDSFSLMLLSLFVMMSMVVFAVSFSSWESSLYSFMAESKELGLSLAGHNSTLFTGMYYYNSVAICYKSLEERRTLGAPLDFGYVLVRNPEKLEDFESYTSDFIQDYSNQKYEVEDERLAQFFWNATPFRKQTDLTNFQMVVTSLPLESPPPGYELNYSGERIASYSK